MGLLDYVAKKAENFAVTGGLINGRPVEERQIDTNPLATSLAGALESMPFGDMVRAVAEGIADAQFELDLGSAKIAQLMAGMEVDGVVLGNQGRFRFGGRADEPDSASEVTLLELGFAPTFYQFSKVDIEIKMTVKIHQETLDKRSAWDIKAGASYTSAAPWQKLIGWGPAHSVSANASFVNTENSAKYSFDGELSSRVKTTLRPVEPPTLLTERIQQAINGTRGKVPDLTNKSWKEAMELLAAADLNYELAGGLSVPTAAEATTKKVAGFSPAAGERAEKVTISSIA